MVSYAEFLEKQDAEDCRTAWILWKMSCYGMPYDEAAKAADDPEWGYEPIRK